MIQCIEINKLIHKSTILVIYLFGCITPQSDIMNMIILMNKYNDSQTVAQCIEINKLIHKSTILVIYLFGCITPQPDIMNMIILMNKYNDSQAAI